MKSMLDKLGIYDFLGYIIPGFFGILAAKVIYLDILKIKFPIDLSNTFIDSIIFLVIAYFSGVIMHEISQVIQELILKKIWGGFPSERFLLKADKQCSDIEKAQYYKLAKDAFGIDDCDYTKEKSQLVFDKFRIALQIAGKDERSQLFNTYYGMYRNFSAGCFVCFLVYLIYTLYFGINLLFWKTWLTNDFSFVVNGLISLVFSVILFRRTRRFGETYVKYVFRGFAEVHRNSNTITKQ